MKEQRFRKMIEFIDNVAMDINEYTSDLIEYTDKLFNVRYNIIEEFIYGKPQPTELFANTKIEDL